MPGKEEFIQIYQEHIRREGSEELLDYLQNKSDFSPPPPPPATMGPTPGACATTASTCSAVWRRTWPGTG